jgi:hypothetical protein
MTGRWLQLVFADSWNFTSNNYTIVGRKTANQRFLAIGMVSITVVKSQTNSCFRDQPCYSADATLQEPSIDLVIPPTAKDSGTTLQIPYNTFTGGYSVGLPSSISPQEQATLLKAYRPLFGQDTTAIHVQTVLLNPHGSSTVTTLGLKGEFSVYGVVNFNVRIDTVPYRPLPAHDMELAVFVLAIMFFYRPYFNYWFCEPDFKCRDFQGHARYLTWLRKWENLARSNTGKPTGAYVPMMAGLIISGVIWIVFCTLYHGLRHGDSILADEGYSGGWSEVLSETMFHDRSNATKLVIDTVNSFQKYQHLFNTLVRISFCYNAYFLCQTAIVGIMLWVLIEHVRFHKRMSHMTDILKGVYKEISGIFLLLSLVCAMIGIMCALSSKWRVALQGIANVTATRSRLVEHGIEMLTFQNCSVPRPRT